MLLVSAISVCFDFDMSAKGQAEKNSLRAYVFRFAPISRHFLGPSARLKGAHSEVPEAGNLVRISSEIGRKRRLGQPAALGQLRAIVQPNCGSHFLRKSKQASHGGDGIHLATAKSRCRALFYPVRRFRS